MTDSEQERAIYDAYPRHVAPRAALKSIQKAAERLVKDGVLPSAEMARRFLWKKATEYARSPAGQKPPGHEDYRPHPATWFNQERYFDDPAEWQKPNGASNGKQIGTKAARTVDAAAAAIERIENRNRPGATGDDEGRRVQPDDAGDARGRTIEGTV